MVVFQFFREFIGIAPANFKSFEAITNLVNLLLLLESELLLHIQFEECDEVRFVVFGEETKGYILSSYKKINRKYSVAVTKLHNLLYY